MSFDCGTRLYSEVLYLSRTMNNNNLTTTYQLFSNPSWKVLLFFLASIKKQNDPTLMCYCYIKINFVEN